MSKVLTEHEHGGSCKFEIVQSVEVIARACCLYCGRMIEPEEIEAMLNNHADLLEACRAVEEAWAGNGDMSVAVDKCLLAIQKARES